MLARGRRAAGQKLSPGAPGHALHLVLVALQAGPALKLPGLLVPDCHSPVKAGAGEVVATRRPGDSSDGPGVTLREDCLTLPALPLQAPQPDGLVLPAGGQHGAGRMPGAAPHSACVTRQDRCRPHPSRGTCEVQSLNTNTAQWLNCRDDIIED